MSDKALSECCKRGRILKRAIRFGHRDGVGAGLAFDSELPADPPHGRIKEQKRLDQHLAKVHEIVVAPNMGQLVDDDDS